MFMYSKTEGKKQVRAFKQSKNAKYNSESWEKRYIVFEDTFSWKIFPAARVSGTLLLQCALLDVATSLLAASTLVTTLVNLP